MKFETLKRIKDNDETIIKRENNNFVFNGTNLPKLSQKVTSISLLKEEEEIQKIYDGFRRVITRRFYGNELSENYAIYSLNNNIVSKYKKNRNLQNLMHEKIGFKTKCMSA